jgi:hypothetical protein
MRRCKLVTEGSRFLQQRSALLLTPVQLAKVSSDETFYINVHIWVLYETDDENIELKQIQAQWKMLNACYNGKHGNLKKIPNTGYYNFESLIGNPRVTFLPSNYEDLDEDYITRKKIVGGAFDVQSVKSLFSQEGWSFETDKLNLVICRCDGFLGEAEVGGTVTVIETFSVGGVDARGTLTSFDLGMTMVHETGHLLSLPHTFDSSCSKVHDDVPKQMNANYDFILAQVDGKWTGSLCNRFRDCKIYGENDDSYKIPGEDPPYSCWGGQCHDETFEMGCNIMDYAVDEFMIMFTHDQATAIREFLVSTNSPLTLVNGDGGEVSNTTVTDAEGTPDALTNTRFSSNSWVTWLLVGIGGLLVLIFIGLLIWKYKKVNKDK